MSERESERAGERARESERARERKREKERKRERREREKREKEQKEGWHAWGPKESMSQCTITVVSQW